MLPHHLWIILDGNRRRAKQRGLSTAEGHLAGAQRLEEILQYGFQKGIKTITVYAFSSENRKREASEVEALMKLFLDYLTIMTTKLANQEIQVQILGEKSAFSAPLQEAMHKLETSTASKNNYHFNLCLNYGGRAELTQAMKLLAQQVQEGKLQAKDIDEQKIANSLYTAGQADPDLIIRTSGEKRLSGFLTWQSSYAELLFIDTLRPDFSPAIFDECMIEYQNRQRRFGK